MDGVGGGCVVGGGEEVGSGSLRFLVFLVFGSFGVGDGVGDGEVRCAPSPLTPSPPFFAGHRRIEALALLNNVFPRSQHKHRKHPQTPHHTAPHRTARAVDVEINCVECPASSSSLLLLRAPVVSPSGFSFWCESAAHTHSHFFLSRNSPPPLTPSSPTLPRVSSAIPSPPAPPQPPQTSPTNTTNTTNRPPHGAYQWRPGVWGVRTWVANVCAGVPYTPVSRRDEGCTWLSRYTTGCVPCLHSCLGHVPGMGSLTPFPAFASVAPLLPERPTVCIAAYVRRSRFPPWGHSVGSGATT